VTTIFPSTILTECRMNLHAAILRGRLRSLRANGSAAPSGSTIARIGFCVQTSESSQRDFAKRKCYRESHCEAPLLGISRLSACPEPCRRETWRRLIVFEKIQKRTHQDETPPAELSGSNPAGPDVVFERPDRESDQVGGF
jgi:hypothetical protein